MVLEVKMYISPKLKWTKEYVDLAKSVVPEIRYIKKILAQRVKEDLTRNPGFEGQLTKNGPRNYTMSLYTNYVKKDKIHPVAHFSIRDLSKIELLFNLAHELAHVKHWNHTPDRQILESTLTIMFMSKLKEEGYISEEETEGIEY